MGGEGKTFSSVALRAPLPRRGRGQSAISEHRESPPPQPSPIKGEGVRGKCNSFPSPLVGKGGRGVHRASVIRSVLLLEPGRLDCVEDLLVGFVRIVREGRQLLDPFPRV